MGIIRNDGKWSDISSVKLPGIKSRLNSLVKMLSIKVSLTVFIFVGIEITGKRKLDIILLKKTEVSSCL